MRTQARSRGWAVASAVVLAVTAASATDPVLGEVEGAPVPESTGTRSYAAPPGVLIAPGDSPALTLLYTGNVVGYVEPCG